MTGLVAIAALLGLGVVVVYAYNKGRQASMNVEPPVILAEEGPSKIRPENPGGMKVPNQDKEVFSRLIPKKQSGKVERLLPSPENPMAPPAPDLKKALTSDNIGPGGVTLMVAPSKSPKKKLTAEKQLAVTAEAKAAEKPSAIAEKAASKPKLGVEKKTAVARRSASGLYRVQISSLRSEVAVQKNWLLLRKKHSDLLGRLALKIEPVTLKNGKGKFYRMQVGPFASRQVASNLCAGLKKRKQSCIIVRR
jgi:hypothetical protein